MVIGIGGQCWRCSEMGVKEVALVGVCDGLDIGEGEIDSKVVFQVCVGSWLQSYSRWIGEVWERRL